MARGFVGARTLNLELQKALNPPHDKSIQKLGWFFCVNDKVMQIENNYQKEVYNGDIGLIHLSLGKKEKWPKLMGTRFLGNINAPQRLWFITMTLETEDSRCFLTIGSPDITINIRRFTVSCL